MIKREIVETVYEYDGEGKLIKKTVTQTKEEEENLVSVRSRFAGDEGQKSLDAFVASVAEEIATRERREVVKEEN